ncbi:hypothetical protein J2X20_004208 [Pelomonas saccharophila]|uniref:PEP-CTERM protein-sorting domain-containing protein n=1 Tax=Roseateles saccharophilus TaxID=304 RepID=A0ABU1YRQ4_ROSSA|nr:PEP-CTERM sorting domain-containing protein [Roseateles saccharophilus]MDR7271540.1 hypothetical protein [Roseateles saccharophilus]
MRRTLHAALISAMLACCPPSLAGLLGKDMVFECLECTPSTSDHFVAVAGPRDYLLSFDEYVWNEVDVEDSSITILWLMGGYTRSPLFFRLTWSPQQYRLAHASIAAGSSIEPGYSWGPGELVVGVGGWDFVQGDHVTFNLVASPVPEPATGLLAALGTILLWRRARRDSPPQPRPTRR